MAADDGRQTVSLMSFGPTARLRAIQFRARIPPNEILSESIRVLFSSICRANGANDSLGSLRRRQHDSPRPRDL